MSADRVILLAPVRATPRLPCALADDAAAEHADPVRQPQRAGGIAKSLVLRKVTSGAPLGRFAPLW